MQEKIVAFAGHRYAWHSIGIEEKLYQTLEELINKGYTTFYDGGYGSFDKKCVDTILKLRTKYPHIKLIKIHAYYHHDKDRFVLPDYYNDSIYTDIENYHFKQVITKRNEWIVDHCDILVCHIEETYKSGAYNTVKYARKINKPIIYL